ncbi:MAG: hypothetical protein AAF689_17835 [Pseudomonadota bacterium]
MITPIPVPLPADPRFEIPEEDHGNSVSTPIAEQLPNVMSTPVQEQGPVVVSTPVADSIIPDTVASSPLRHALGIPRGHTDRAHHNIPMQHRGHPVVEAAIRGGFEFNGAMNGTRVVGQAGGGHRRYNEGMLAELNELDTLGLSDQEAHDALRDLPDQARDIIENDWGGFVRNEGLYD